MKLHFHKYQGTGNDFVLIDNRDNHVKLTNAQVAFLCNRHMGIGADGLMLLEQAGGYDFRMVYYNADGNESTMCGNGGRCITAFAQKLGIIKDKAGFVAVDGPHHALINKDGTISLHMQDVKEIREEEDYTELNTGSPHYVTFVSNVQQHDVVNRGRTIRNLERYQPKGINVNFVERISDNSIRVRTYERGVEDETLSCGTGVTASAIAATKHNRGVFDIQIITTGGDLRVSFIKNSPTTVHDVILTGPATWVFEGDVEI